MNRLNEIEKLMKAFNLLTATHPGFLIFFFSSSSEFISFASFILSGFRCCCCCGQHHQRLPQRYYLFNKICRLIISACYKWPKWKERKRNETKMNCNEQQIMFFFKWSIVSFVLFNVKSSMNCITCEYVCKSRRRCELIVFNKVIACVQNGVRIHCIRWNLKVSAARQSHIVIFYMSGYGYLWVHQTGGQTARHANDENIN